MAKSECWVLAMLLPANLSADNDRKVPVSETEFGPVVASKDPMRSNFRVLGKGERVFQVYPEIAHRIFDLAMAEQKSERRVGCLSPGR